MRFGVWVVRILGGAGVRWVRSGWCRLCRRRGGSQCGSRGLRGFALGWAAAGFIGVLPGWTTPKAGRQPFTVTVKLDNVAAGEQAYVAVAAVDLGIPNLTYFKVPAPAGWLFCQRPICTALRDLYGPLLDPTLGMTRPLTPVWCVSPPRPGHHPSPASVPRGWLALGLATALVQACRPTRYRYGGPWRLRGTWPPTASSDERPNGVNVESGSGPPAPSAKLPGSPRRKLIR